MFGNANDLKKDPIHHLYQVYVKINALAKQDESIDKKANAYFKAMEDGQPKILSQWKLFRELSIESYRDIYKRLNIVFDHYSGESETEPYISKVYHILEQYNLIDKSDLDGSLTINLEPYKLGKVKVKRADGTSLYITRDLASLMLRRERYPFNKAVYVIGTEQSLYMKQLFKISELIAQHDPSWPTDLHHANFGRVLGMSTRKGTVVFLQDILDNAKEAMLSTTSLNNQIRFDELAQLGISNTKEAIDYVADQLGSSAVIIQDMAAKRIKDYEFSWDRMVASKGNTGVYLQYTYARMCG